MWCCVVLAVCKLYINLPLQCYRKLLIGHMKSLKIVQHGMCFEFYIADRSVQRVEVAGYVVSKKVASKKVVLYIDDGTGVIQTSHYLLQSSIWGMSWLFEVES